MHRSTHIAVTCIGGRYMYDFCAALRSAKDLHPVLIGVDANPEVVGRRFVDHFSVLPMAERDPDRYVAELLALHAQIHIDVILPGSEAECRVLAVHRDTFLSAGIIPAVPPQEHIERMTDKFAALEWFSQHGIAVGPYTALERWSDVSEAANVLGYPNRRVVLKPRRSTGSRGITILDARASTVRALLPEFPERVCVTGSLDAIDHLFADRGTSLAGYLAMPYYGGAVYDVDCVASHGAPIHVIPRLRLYDPLLPVNAGCRVSLDPDIVEYAYALTRAFATHGACDFDIARDDDGSPRVLDVSARMSGAVGAAVVAGVNIPAEVVRVLLGRPLQRTRAVDGMEVFPVAHLVRTDVCVPVPPVSVPSSYA